MLNTEAAEEKIECMAQEEKSEKLKKEMASKL